MKIIILAGGGGTRLFPLSRSEYPKQFLKIFRDASLLAQSIERALAIANPEDIVIITGEKHQFHVKNELSLCGVKGAHVLVEKAGRNTAPAIALAVNFCKNKLCCPDGEIVLVTPSDHLVDPLEKFVHGVGEGISLAAGGEIVVFGVKPDSPETGYGYVKAGERRGNGWKVERFKEKPDAEAAREYINAGGYFWNSGMAAFRLDSFARELEKCSPEIFAFFQLPYEELWQKFDQMPNISIDYALTEISREISMIELDCAWSDVGSWDCVYGVMEKDENANALKGDVVAINCGNSLFVGHKRLIAGLGLADVLVVDTDDVLLVAKRGESQLVKKLVEDLKKAKRPEVDSANTVYRPWGYFVVHDSGSAYKIKTIVVHPGESLSLQMHWHRSEHWVVTGGAARVLIGEREQTVYKNQSIFVPCGVKHRIHNPGLIPLEIVEVQSGEYLGEDDIVRFDDDYGR
ncbi:MAG: mannose-1-phosphate guanylyltransferase/mannose-6-phosphate isomerase [Acidaminococcales bacterium]|jgi:mannose-1-phosphate guanylyltransferase/mannose-6-phosphate isomerase|nr:mannose-1-phosphate guanylyltransferase/mannose-6-phosphate isomerase [Acidaminococcales bacterium]